MQIIVNGQARNVSQTNLDEVLTELGFASARIATAVNGEFVPRSQRVSATLHNGDRLEVLAPMKGG